MTITSNYKICKSAGMWPIRSDTNFESGILDNSLVLGYEDWMILDMLTYVSTMTYPAELIFYKHQLIYF